MTGINETTLVRMREQLSELLPDTCTILEPVRVADDEGGFTTSYSPVAGGTVACRLDPLYYRVTAREIGAMHISTSHFLLTVPHDAPIEPHQRVEISGAEYRVLTLADEHSWRLSRRAYVLRFD